MSDRFKELLEQRRAEYKGYMPVFCPVLKEYVIFNAKGFNHLLFRPKGREREQTEQIARLNILPFASRIIQFSIGLKRRERRTAIGKTIKYWGLESVINGQRIRVVLRRIGNGKLHFWSIMQAW
jgi:hypothetical protein